MTTTHLIHHFAVPMLGGRLRCSKWKCSAVMMPPNRPVPAQEHSPTSVAAARAISGAPRHLDRVIVYRALVEAGAQGMTDEELQDATGLGGSTERPRRIDLVAENVVEDSKRVRRVRSGRSATVWVIRSAGDWRPSGGFVKAEQPALFHVARSDSRFTRETLRRGGPYETQGRRWRSQKAARIAHESSSATERGAMPQSVMEAIAWKPRRMG